MSVEKTLQQQADVCYTLAAKLEDTDKRIARLTQKRTVIQAELDAACVRKTVMREQAQAIIDNI